MTKPLVWIGIDPGAKGAICVLSEDDEVLLYDYSVSGIDGYAQMLTELSTLYNIKHILLESVHSMPGQGVKSMFSFGQRFGELQGMLIALQLGFTLVPPKEWQKLCGIKDTTSKSGIMTTMNCIYPLISTKLTGPRGGIIDGRVDALGIAHAARIKFNK